MTYRAKDKVYIIIGIYRCLIHDYDTEVAKFLTVKNISADKRFSKCMPAIKTI